jgi:ribonuclease HI
MNDALAAGKVVIFTDGACTGNPGPGGWGAILRFKEHRKELSGGYRRTTNNRMELLACIEALRQLKRRSQVVLFSDSNYVVNGIELGWAKRWKARGWIKSDKKPAENPDLWGELLNLVEQHDVTFVWLRGHAGMPENERCDEMAVRAAHLGDLPEDAGYKK